MLNLVQLAVLAFFSKRIHDCGLSGWVGAVAKAFGWSVLAGILSGVLTMAATMVLFALVGFVFKRAITTPTRSPAARSAAAKVLSLQVTKPGTLELSGPPKFAGSLVFVVLQVLLLLRFTRCA